jgi:hypothetical protein
MAGSVLFHWLFNHMASPSFLLLHLIAKPVDRHKAEENWQIVYMVHSCW